MSKQARKKTSMDPQADQPRIQGARAVVGLHVDGRGRHNNWSVVEDAWAQWAWVSQCIKGGRWQ